MILKIINPILDFGLNDYDVNITPLYSLGGRCGSGVWQLCGGFALAPLSGRTSVPCCASRPPPRSQPSSFGFPSAGRDTRRRRPR